MERQRGEIVDRLVEKLKTVRDAYSREGEPERREAIRQALRSEMAGVSEGETERVLDGVRAALIQEARAREERITRLEAELRESRTREEALRLEHDRLRAERAAPPPAPVRSEAPSGAGLEALRGGLRQAVEEGPAPDPSGLPPSDEALFRFVRELLRFAVDSALNIQELRANVGVAPDGTRIYKDSRKIIRDRFRACLDGKDGALDPVLDLLRENQRFPVQLHNAYWAALRHGTRGVLAELDPEPIRVTYTGKFTTLDGDKAFREFERKYIDLAGRPTEQLWEEFYFGPFKERLAHDETAGGKARP